MFFRSFKLPSKMLDLAGTHALYFVKSIVISWFFITFSHAEQAPYDLVLAGGALKTCSSFAIKNCVDKQQITGGKSQNRYQISSQGFKRWAKITAFSSIKNAEKTNINSFFNTLNRSLEAMSKDEFLDQIDDIAKDDNFTRDLSDAAYFSLLDSFEILQYDHKGDRLTERVSLADNRNQHAKRVYRAFIEQAKLRVKQPNKANILVVTASSRDPYESADFYLGVLADPDVTVRWLPLDRAWQQAVDLQRKGFAGCDHLPRLRAANLQFYRERVYPKRTQQQEHFCRHPNELVQLIKQSQGLFFNGGDQSKTLAALLTPEGEYSDILIAIHQQVASGQLVVGGTSAGTAVQAGGKANQRPIPMFTNGDPAVAMKRGVFAIDAPSQRCLPALSCDTGLNRDDLTVRAAGGTGLFKLGLLDTHFSERDRETRLAVATFDSKQRLGFGVDETSALLVRYTQNGVQAKVVGEGGVFVVDFSQGQSLQNLTPPEAMRQLSGEAHYLPDGVTFRIQNNQIILQSNHSTLVSRSKSKVAHTGQWRTEVAQRCGSHQSIKWHQFDNMYLLKKSERTRFFNNERQQCGYIYLPFVIDHS